MAVLRYSEASAADATGRLDSSFFEKRYLKLRQRAEHWQSLSNYANSVVCGPFGSNLLNDNYVEQGIPMIRPFNLRNVRVDRGEIAFLSPKFVNDAGLKTFSPGAIMFARVGEIGAGINLYEEATISPNIIVAELNESINPYFVGVFANTQYGRMQLEAGMKVVAQPTISTDAIRDLKIPTLSRAFQNIIEDIFKNVVKEENKSGWWLQQAESTLIEALRLKNWQAPEPLTYLRSSSEAFAVGRLDAEFFNPGIDQLLKRLSCDGLKIRDVAPARKERFTPNETGEFHYIEIGTLNNDGTAQAQCVPQREAPSRATQHVRSHDVITSTVRPNRRLSALISEQQDGFVCSSGFVVLQPKHISGDVLLTYLRLPLICKLMDLYTSASMYPAISESDLLNLPIPRFSTATEKTVEQTLQSARQAKQRAAQLLEAAKRAVEIAIEQSEAEALAYLHNIIESV